MSALATEDIPVSTADICPVSTADVGHVSTADMSSVARADMCVFSTHNVEVSEISIVPKPQC